MKIGLDVEVIIDGRPVKIVTRDDLRQLTDYLNSLLLWWVSAPQFPPIIAEKEENEKSPNPLKSEDISPGIEEVVSETPPKVAGKTSRRQTLPSRTNPPPGERTYDYVVRALRYLEAKGELPERGVRMQQLYPVVLKLGWRSGASNRENAIRVLQIMTRQRSDLVNIQSGYMTLTEKGRQYLLDQRNSTSAQDDEPNYNPDHYKFDEDNPDDYTEDFIGEPEDIDLQS